MCTQILKSKYLLRSKVTTKDAKRNILNVEKNEEDATMQNFASEVFQLNVVIQNILLRNLSDSVLTFYCANSVSECLYDNLELSKTFIYTLFNSYSGIINFTIYDFELDEALKIKTQNIKYRSGVSIVKMKEWNYCLLFKAYTNLVI
jgi:hypothetical protein